MEQTFISLRTPDVVEFALSQFRRRAGGTDHRFSWSVGPSPGPNSLTDDKKRSSVPPLGQVIFPWPLKMPR
jgi:hypothetical protein